MDEKDFEDEKDPEWADEKFPEWGDTDIIQEKDDSSHSSWMMMRIPGNLCAI